MKKHMMFALKWGLHIVSTVGLVVCLLVPGEKASLLLWLFGVIAINVWGRTATDYVFDRAVMAARSRVKKDD